MIADVPLGAFLSGGIDSTAVVTAMVELSSTPVKTFTIGFDVARFDESAQAGAVAALGTDHTVEMLTEREALASSRRSRECMASRSPTLPRCRHIWCRGPHGAT